MNKYMAIFVYTRWEGGEVIRKQYEELFLADVCDKIVAEHLQNIKDDAKDWWNPFYESKYMWLEATVYIFSDDPYEREHPIQTITLNDKGYEYKYENSYLY